jgi:hypothetical protein
MQAACEAVQVGELSGCGGVVAVGYFHR